MLLKVHTFKEFVAVLRGQIIFHRSLAPQHDLYISNLLPTPRLQLKSLIDCEVNFTTYSACTKHLPPLPAPLYW